MLPSQAGGARLGNIFRIGVNVTSDLSGGGVAHHTSVCFHKGFICLSVPGHLACSLVPSFGVVEVGGPISKQCDLVLKCWIKSVSGLDDNSFVIIIFCQVGELLEVVNVVVNWVLGLVPAGPF